MGIIKLNIRLYRLNLYVYFSFKQLSNRFDTFLWLRYRKCLKRAKIKFVK